MSSEYKPAKGTADITRSKEGCRQLTRPSRSVLSIGFDLRADTGALQDCPTRLKKRVVLLFKQSTPFLAELPISSTAIRDRKTSGSSILQLSLLSQASPAPFLWVWMPDLRSFHLKQGPRFDERLLRPRKHCFG